MYIFKSDTPDGVEEYLSKSSKSPLSPTLVAEANLARLQIAPVVPAQTALLAGAAVAPTGLVLSNIADLIANAGAISTIGQPATQEDALQVANADSNSGVAASLEAFSKNLLSNADAASLMIVPVANLSDSDLGQHLSTLEARSPLAQVAALSSEPVQERTMIDVSSLHSMAIPVLITGLSEHTLTVIDSALGNVQIEDFVAPQAIVENFINTGVGVLTVTTAATHVASLTLSGNVAFTALANEVTCGITVSGESDSSDVTLFLLGGASNTQGSTDFITLGNGNNFVFDAGNGQVLLNLGNGENTILLSGTGVNGVVNFAHHDQGVADFVALASNGFLSAQELASHALITIAGLNNDAQSHDAIAFLGDMNGELAWANGSASGAQITSVAGEVASLESWVVAAQAQAISAHSVAWFHFGGNTYVLETAAGSAGDHTADTLVKLTGLTQFTNPDGELSIGMLHLMG